MLAGMFFFVVLVQVLFWVPVAKGHAVWQVLFGMLLVMLRAHCCRIGGRGVDGTAAFCARLTDGRAGGT